jgi:hypothetical protein
VIARGSEASATNELPEADALVSNDPGAVLAVQAADCVPILIVDARRGAASAVHAGWRGTCAGAAVKAVEALRRECGSDPRDLMAAIGPSIGPDDYEVGEEVRAAFAAAGHDRAAVDRWFRASGSRLHLDLWTATSDQLVSAGVSSDRIHTARLSTARHPGLLPSYRRDGPRAGRLAALIVVPQ